MRSSERKLREEQKCRQLEREKMAIVDHSSQLSSYPRYLQYQTSRGDCPALEGSRSFFFFFKLFPKLTKFKEI